ncbi:UvrB/UvrC motif-containing protein, partial [Candidatus Saccharibacteria bacterium]|nr:UvrB/UvrC motif-containing protein [Candidatus Saccharibacteria bacterium]
DADKEGFLRSEAALVQTIGRAARHIEGTVIMYADSITKSMKYALDETTRRRNVQQKYNQDHNITPQGIQKALSESMRSELGSESKEAKMARRDLKKIPKEEVPSIIKDLNLQMDLAAKNLEFEKAADLRDLIDSLQKKL